MKLDAHESRSVMTRNSHFTFPFAPQKALCIKQDAIFSDNIDMPTVSVTLCNYGYSYQKN